MFLSGTKMKFLLLGAALAGFNLDTAGVFVSSGSACTAGSIDPSHVLVAMFGKAAPELRSSIRFSFGQGLTDELIAEASQRTVEIIKRTVK